jgi:SAM-dependent methyltransferase
MPGSGGRCGFSGRFLFVPMSTHPHQPIHGQYLDSKNLTARIRMHQLFSTNPHGWMRWVYDQMTYPADACVLELGCGNGELWRTNAGRIPGDATIVLTDSSEGMLQETKKTLRQLSDMVHFAAVDARSVPFKDRSFDVVIANHMLYHVDSPADAIRVIWRVLRPDGVVYATTNGVDHLKEIPELLNEFDALIECPLSATAQRFCLVNGADQFSGAFPEVTVVPYQDSLRVTEAEPVIDYLLSLRGVGNVVERLSGDKTRQLGEFLTGRIVRHGPITVTKDSGMLIARK